jgi:hypothetical protein
MTMPLGPIIDLPGAVRSPWNITAKKTTQSVSANTTLQNDNELFFPMAPNTTYQFQLVALVSTPANADFKFGFNGPSSPTSMSVNHVHKADGFSGDSGKTAYETTGVAGLHTGVTEGVTLMWGVITNGSTPGNFQFTWAQNTSQAANTSVLRGSYIIWRVVD